ncbi:ADP-ribosylation factor GTPase-activating protein AGD12 [Triticum urartu]|uniref:ADP-ribosylation factor GTPase-activating protein AGD12 n=2 Tax=Triticum urartu TaxID=4572 RepID=M8ABZ2_TRIUA|nr:ADP-ribosylation factor GTPase-activating protein AGD12 [Triticum urartu]
MAAGAASQLSLSSRAVLEFPPWTMCCVAAPIAANVAPQHPPWPALHIRFSTFTVFTMRCVTAPVAANGASPEEAPRVLQGAGSPAARSGGSGAGGSGVATRLNMALRAWLQRPSRKETSTAIDLLLLRGSSMERLLGLLKVKVVSGVNLAICDPLAHSSDPYVAIRLGQQKVKSGIKYKSTKPEWNEELTLSITNWTLPVKIDVFDHDTFTKDDSMGDAEFSILNFVEIAKKDFSHVPDDTVMKTIHPDKGNCFSTESHITWKDGKVSQNIVLKLRNTDTGEIILHLERVNIPGTVQ